MGIGSINMLNNSEKDPIHVAVEKGYLVIYLFLLKLYYLYFSNPVQLNLKFEVRWCIDCKTKSSTISKIMFYKFQGHK